MISVGNEKKDHFTGAVVYKESSGSYTEANLVDGQQRVTTILLIIKALNLVCSIGEDVNNFNNSDKKYIYTKSKSYLYVDSEDERVGFKLASGRADDKVFKIIMNLHSFDEFEKNPYLQKISNDALKDNFDYVYKYIFKYKDDTDFLRNIFFEGLKYLTVAEMVLDEKDEAQEIFESINSLGLKLNNSELIRNYLLMSERDQESLYDNYWGVIQNVLIGEDKMETFVFDYLAMKTGSKINNIDIYREYKKFAIKSFNENRESLLKDLKLVAEIYQIFLRKEDTYSKTTNDLMKELRDMDQTTSYPFLLQVFMDFKKKEIDEKCLNNVINLIVSYHTRRIICGVGSSSLRGFFLNLYNRIFNIPENKNKYYDAIYSYFMQIDSVDRFRSDDEVAESLKTNGIYSQSKVGFTIYLLDKLQNGRYPNPDTERTVTENPSVEHIMPQTLTDDWRLELGANAEEIHSKYLNTLGNLSLSSRSKNSIMSNENFAFKKSVLKKHGSKYSVLNGDIDSFNKFSEAEIKNRGNRLSKLLIEKYKIEELNSGVIHFDNVIELVLNNNYDQLTGTEVVGYKFNGNSEVTVKTYSKILFDVVNQLFKINPELMKELASSKFIAFEQGTKPFICYNAPKDEPYISIGEENNVFTGLSASSIGKFCQILIEKFGLSAGSLVFVIKSDSYKAHNSKKFKVINIRQALADLASKNEIVYEPDKMPNGDSWIKFSTNNLQTIATTDYSTSWDGAKFNSIAYLEYCVSEDTIYLTIKNLRKKASVMLKKIDDNINIITDAVPAENATWWHILSYRLDKKIISSNDKEAFINELERLLVKINDDISKIISIIR